MTIDERVEQAMRYLREGVAVERRRCVDILEAHAHLFETDSIKGVTGLEAQNTAFALRQAAKEIDGL